MDQQRLRLVNELRSKLGLYLALEPTYDDQYGFNLLRWLNEYDNDINKIVPKLKEALELRRSFKFDELGDFIDSGEFRKDVNPLMLNYFPGGISGIDKNGNVVYFLPVGFTSPKEGYKFVRCSEFIKWRLFETEYYFRLILKQEKLLKKKCGLVMIIDVHGLAREHFHLPALSMFTAQFSAVQAYYPDILEKAIIVNAPTLVTVGYKILLPFIFKRNLSKAEFLSSDERKWKNRLCDMIDPEYLPVHWGGTQTGKFGKYGNVVMGGKYPLELRPQHPSYSKSELEHLHVDRGSVSTVPFYLEQKSKVTWYFTCVSGGLWFGIRRIADVGYDEDDADECIDDGVVPVQWVVPKLFLHVDHVPEYGEYEFESGSYELVFDNTNSRLWSRKILYMLCMKDDTEPEQ